MLEAAAGSAGSQVRVVADGVAYAPHLPIDVKAWGVDWYGFSVYKTWGPHMAALYGSHDAFQDLKAFFFFFFFSTVVQFACNCSLYGSIVWQS